MEVTPRLMNLFLLTKLPSAYFCGVRVRNLSGSECKTVVKHRWINQNPFKSIYFAVQAMAAELSTGALVFNQIKKSGSEISMLVVAHKSVFFKKATGVVTFTCSDGELISDAVRQTIATGEGQLIWMKSHATNQKGEAISEMEFQWSIKLKR